MKTNASTSTMRWSRFALPARYDRPDRVAVQALQDAYSAAREQGYTTRTRLWPVPVLVTLGRLYVQAWGEAPTPSRLQAQWRMPERKTIIQAFGSYAAYYAIIQQEP